MIEECEGCGRCHFFSRRNPEEALEQHIESINKATELGSVRVLREIKRAIAVLEDLRG
jgi:hypothetical protein